MRAAALLLSVALTGLVAAGASGAGSTLRYTGTYTSSTGARFRLTITLPAAPAVRSKRTKSGTVQLRPASAAATLTVRNLDAHRRARVLAPPVTLEVDALYRVPAALGGGYVPLSAAFTSVHPLTLRGGGSAALVLDPSERGALLTVPASRAAAFRRLYRGAPDYLLVGAFGAALGERDAVRKGSDCQGYVLAFAGRRRLPIDAAVCDRLTALRRYKSHS